MCCRQPFLILHGWKLDCEKDCIKVPHPIFAIHIFLNCLIVFLSTESVLEKCLVSWTTALLLLNYSRPTSHPSLHSFHSCRKVNIVIKRHNIAGYFVFAPTITVPYKASCVSLQHFRDVLNQLTEWFKDSKNHFIRSWMNLFPNSEPHFSMLPFLPYLKCCWTNQFIHAISKQFLFRLRGVFIFSVKTVTCRHL